MIDFLILYYANKPMMKEKLQHQHVSLFLDDIDRQASSSGARSEA